MFKYRLEIVNQFGEEVFVDSFIQQKKKRKRNLSIRFLLGNWTDFSNLVFKTRMTKTKI